MRASCVPWRSRADAVCILVDGSRDGQVLAVNVLTPLCPTDPDLGEHCAQTTPCSCQSLILTLIHHSSPPTQWSLSHWPLPQCNSGSTCPVECLHRETTHPPPSLQVNVIWTWRLNPAQYTLRFIYFNCLRDNLNRVQREALQVG